MHAGQADQSLHTQLSVDTHEVFLDYRHNASEASDVTFNLKDFKAVLVLCEGLGANVAICFDQPGSPLLVEPLFHSSNPLVKREPHRHRPVPVLFHSGSIQT